MTLNELKYALTKIESVTFQLPSGKMVPAHFHVTEIGLVTKHYIDCGGTVRNDKVINFQLWEANDFDHRLAPKKLLSIIELSEDKLGLQNEEIEVEYQGVTIGKYGLELQGDKFLLTALQTDCLAKDHCGIPVYQLPDKKETVSAGCCTPGGGCC